MSEEKPLHVRVAEALGWAVLRQSIPAEERESAWVGVPPERLPNIVSEPVPRYDTDWSATGPLIEKYGITFLQDFGNGWRVDFGNGWRVANEWLTLPGKYATPLVASCHLILALKEAGKL